MNDAHLWPKARVSTIANWEQHQLGRHGTSSKHHSINDVIRLSKHTDGYEDTLIAATLSGKLYRYVYNPDSKQWLSQHGDPYAHPDGNSKRIPGLPSRREAPPPAPQPDQLETPPELQPDQQAPPLAPQPNQQAPPPPPLSDQQASSATWVVPGPNPPRVYRLLHAAPSRTIRHHMALIHDKYHGMVETKGVATYGTYLPNQPLVGCVGPPQDKPYHWPGLPDCCLDLPLPADWPEPPYNSVWYSQWGFMHLRATLIQANTKGLWSALVKLPCWVAKKTPREAIMAMHTLHDLLLASQHCPSALLPPDYISHRPTSHCTVDLFSDWDPDQISDCFPESATEQCVNPRAAMMARLQHLLDHPSETATATPLGSNTSGFVL